MNTDWWRSARRNNQTYRGAKHISKHLKTIFSADIKN